MSENSQGYTRKPQRNRLFMNLASELHEDGVVMGPLKSFIVVSQAGWWPPTQNQFGLAKASLLYNRAHQGCEQAI